MKDVLKFEYKGMAFKIEPKGQLKPEWENGQEVDTYKITVSTLKTKPFDFMFYDSIYNTARNEASKIKPSLSNTARVCGNLIKLSAIHKWKKNDEKNELIYSVLHCIQSDLLGENEDFDDFCSNYGYSNDSIKALRLFERVQKHRKGLESVFSSWHREIIYSDFQEDENKLNAVVKGLKIEAVKA